MRLHILKTKCLPLRDRVRPCNSIDHQDIDCRSPFRERWKFGWSIHKDSLQEDLQSLELIVRWHICQQLLILLHIIGLTHFPPLFIPDKEPLRSAVPSPKASAGPPDSLIVLLNSETTSMSCWNFSSILILFNSFSVTYSEEHRGRDCGMYLG